jgi:hypothetical protein
MVDAKLEQRPLPAVVRSCREGRAHGIAHGAVERTVRRRPVGHVEVAGEDDRQVLSLRRLEQLLDRGRVRREGGLLQRVRQMDRVDDERQTGASDLNPHPRHLRNAGNREGLSDGPPRENDLIAQLRRVICGNR